MSKKFLMDYTIDLTDLDYMNIVGNAAWLLILQKARGNLLEQLGYPLSRLFSEGIGGVVNEARILYVRGGRFGDRVTIETEATDPFDRGAILRHRILNAQGKIMVKASLTLVFVSNADGYRGTAMPEEIRKGLFG